MLSNTLKPGESIIHGCFQAISITTTTGFATQDFAYWPSFLPVMLLMFSFMGGCVGSTGGGIKAMRLMLIYKQGMRELKQLVHPSAVIPLEGGQAAGGSDRGQRSLEFLRRLYVGIHRYHAVC